MTQFSSVLEATSDGNEVLPYNTPLLLPLLRLKFIPYDAFWFLESRQCWLDIGFASPLHLPTRHGTTIYCSLEH
jgi:hypothetical protein